MRRRLRFVSSIIMSLVMVALIVFSNENVSMAKSNNSHNPTKPFIKGVDISTLKAIEDHGGKYYDHGKQKDLLVILKEHGVNYIRLRLWNNPTQANGYDNLANTIAIAKRAKSMGFKFLLDIHYSDFWADPGKQTKPAAWKELDFEQLTQTVHQYTSHVIEELVKAGAAPDMVQIGNEITSGILWPDGKTWGENAGGFDKLAILLKAGIQGVYDHIDKKHVKIMLHIDGGGDNSKSRWFFDNITQRHVPFDVIGLSYYPYWHGTLAQLQNNMDDISKRYNKDVVIAETAYAYTLNEGDNEPNVFTAKDAAVAGYDVSVHGQAKFLKDLMNTIYKVPNGKGLGFFYWEPAWIPVKGAGWKAGGGDGWENQALFDFKGNVLPSLNVFKRQRPVLTFKK